MTKNSLTILTLIVIFFWISFGVKSELITLWLIILLARCFRAGSRLMRVLLYLEMLVMLIILSVSFQARGGQFRTLIFYLIIIVGVVEGVLGLSLLVQLRAAKKNILSSLFI